MTQKSKNFAKLLKRLRTKSGLSQLQLSLLCSVSQKHISFLELDRVSPSRVMVLTIGKALSLSLSDRNALLLGAGFAPAYEKTELNATEIAVYDHALSITLAQHEPFPAVVADGCYNILRTNNGAVKFQTWLYGVERPEDLPAIARNMVRGIFLPEGYGSYVKNWDECAYYLYRGLSNQVPTTRCQEILEELQRGDYIPMEWHQRMLGDRPIPPLLTMNFERDRVKLNLFGTTTTFGTPTEKNFVDAYIQSIFPADDTTRQFFENGPSCTSAPT